MYSVVNFNKTLHSLLETYGLNASQFAGRIGVPRSSISHLLSGRNKPSLDFILKILNAFPELSFEGLVTGKIEQDKNEVSHSPALPPEQTEMPGDLFHQDFVPQGVNQPYEAKREAGGTSVKKRKTSRATATPVSGVPVKIILLYDDGSFEWYRYKV